MNCPRCGLNYFRFDGQHWMCYACGHVPFDGQWFAAAVLIAAALSLLLLHACTPALPVLLTLF